MIVNQLKLIYDQNKDQNLLYLRNLLKEQLQYFILNFVYNSIYAESFLFKGGTCLRFCFDLPRLSEDLDFDVEAYNKFSFEHFSSDLKNYFKSKLKYDELKVKISGRNKIIYLQFPILRSINFPVNPEKPTDEILFVRIDLAPISGEFFQKEISPKSTPNFSFLITRYSFPDLFAGKIAAILTRETREGESKIPRFKGRDFFDLFWFLEKKVPPNFDYLRSLTNLSKLDAIKQLKDKLKQAKKWKKEMKKELYFFFADPNFVENFINNFDQLEKQFNLL